MGTTSAFSSQLEMKGHLKSDNRCASSANDKEISKSRSKSDPVCRFVVRHLSTSSSLIYGLNNTLQWFPSHCVTATLADGLL